MKLKVKQQASLWESEMFAKIREKGEEKLIDDSEPGERRSGGGGRKKAKDADEDDDDFLFDDKEEKDTEKDNIDFNEKVSDDEGIAEEDVPEVVSLCIIISSLIFF